jgi:hypothetical protein
VIAAVLVRFAYLAFTALWLLRMTDGDEDVEILALRHQCGPATTARRSAPTIAVSEQGGVRSFAGACILTAIHRRVQPAAVFLFAAQGYPATPRQHESVS